ncbi:MAG: zinc-binding dehydrogenase [Candidatus Bathyarchaeota archaeon]|nr:zinc-binding dehydrogenase [Candidatus Bathyarchaeota archaeon]
MEAVVKYALGPGNVELRDVSEPSPGPDEVKIEIKAAGICGSDLHILHGDIKLLIRPPVIMGHEFSGSVTEVGSSVSKWKPGDRVTSETSAQVCGECIPCRTGNYNVCAEKRLIGYWFNGAFAKYCIVPSRLVHRLPDNVSYAAGALSEPLACCINAVVEKTVILPGDFVVVTGPGPIGLLSLQLAKAKGGFAVLVGTGVDEKRLGIGRELGANVTVNVDEEDPLKIVSGLTNGAGADIFIECSGSPGAVRSGFQLVRRGGQYTQIGLTGRSFELDFDNVAYKELTVRGSLGQSWPYWKRGLKMLSQGQVKTEPLISDILPLQQWKEGFGKVENKEGLKVILKPE